MNRQSEPVDRGLGKLLGMPADRPVVLLHSGRFHERWARRSLLAQPRGWYRYWADGRSEVSGFQFQVSGKLWRDLRELLHDPRLGGQWFGYFGYDICRVIEREKLGLIDRDQPVVELAWCPQVEEIETVGDGGWSMGEGRSETRNLEPDIHSNFTRSQYEAAVRRVIDYIAAGDVFQVNLSQQLQCTWSGDPCPRRLFARLATVSPAWYGAYLELPGSATDGHSRFVLSTSPELFLQVENGHVITRPIKGTDSQSPLQLRDSVKDTAELNMIVDLMRNDLGKVCSYGSVQVTARRDIETHPTIHHGVATIEGDLHPRKDIVDLLRATLPGGSITGAPKVRAMQIIDELEPCSRGVYCGAIGWLTGEACQFNVAIRTMTMNRDKEGYRVTFPVGGGIVADSNPAAEYDETIAKAQAMLQALGGD